MRLGRLEVLAEPLSLRLPYAWMTLRRHTLPAGTGCLPAVRMAVGEPRALASGKSDRVRPLALSDPRAGAGRLVLASHCVTVCDPARRVLGLQWG